MVLSFRVSIDTTTTRNIFSIVIFRLIQFNILIILLLLASNIPSCESFNQQYHHHPFLFSVTNTIPKTYPITLTTPTIAARTTTTNMFSTKTTTTQLQSLRPLLESLEETKSTSTSTSPRLILVGGKGGVGKTTVSSSLAVALASSLNSDLRVLVASTDPAHSLGDALDVDLTSLDNNNNNNKGGPNVVRLTDPLTNGNLFALEVDATAALSELRDTLSTFDPSALASATGLDVSFLKSLGLDEFTSVFKNPPPGLDEIVALSQLLDDEGELLKNGKYDVVIIDTAPTGHTLRMLQLPEFLDGLLGKLLAFRMRLGGLAKTLGSFLGNSGAMNNNGNPADALENALDKLESFRSRVRRLRSRLVDNGSSNNGNDNGGGTTFVAVTVPTVLGISETERLLTELNKQGVAVNNVVVNQCVVNSVDSQDDKSLNVYYKRRRDGQRKWLDELGSVVDDVSSSVEYQENNDGNGGGIKLKEVPYVDVELVGTPALSFLGTSTFVNDPQYRYLLENEDSDTSNNNNESKSKVTICGGKGGVGKTTTSASLAVAMASQGRDVVIVSTDPAHSLGDAFGMTPSMMSVSKNNMPIDVPLIGVTASSNGYGSLAVLEVDPQKSLDDFKGLVDRIVGNKIDGMGGSGDNENENGGEMKKALNDLGGVFDTLPAGTDEVVALARIMNLLRDGQYDRVVLDTAPTGHTLRMIDTPGFVVDLIDSVLAVSKKIDSNPIVKMMIQGAISSGADKNNNGGDSSVEEAREALSMFRSRMYDLEDVFADVSNTEFMVVTIPTELAVRESCRLINDLTFSDSPVRVRNVIANQVLTVAAATTEDDDNKNGGGGGVFLRKVAEGQRSAMKRLRDDLETRGGEGSASKIIVTEVPYLDTEPRGVFGLKALAEELLK